MNIEDAVDRLYSLKEALELQLESKDVMIRQLRRQVDEEKLIRSIVVMRRSS